jgi:tetratricopeptide (TPR) repeat protein
MSGVRPAAAQLCAEFESARRKLGAEQAFAQLTRRLQSQPCSVWLDCARALAEFSGEPASLPWLHEAAQRWPDDVELRYCLALALWQQGETAAAERTLRLLLAHESAHAGANDLLAKLLRNDGRLGAAAQLVYDHVRRSMTSAGDVLRAVDFIRHCQRQALAARLCDDAFAMGLHDAALYAQSGLLALELGRFEAARAHLLEALQHGVDTNSWYVFGALALTRKYVRADDTDFKLFARHLQEQQLAPVARASLEFALAKAYDDVGNRAEASRLWRDANARMRALRPWSAARFEHEVEQLVHAPPASALTSGAIVPIFIVGLPRSGTTLAAVSLGRLPGVRDRGELPHIGFIAQRLAGAMHDTAALTEAAQLYYRHLRQDDAPAHFYIDKTPTNFLRLSLIAQLFPQAHVVHCRRNRRDTALSLYAQHFAHADGDFSYDVADIAAFAAGHDRIMDHWRRTLPLPIHTLDYEDMVQQPDAAIARLREAIGISNADSAVPAQEAGGVIGSSSLWQAKQPVYTSSLGRWHAYASHLPELAALLPDRTL